MRVYEECPCGAVLEVRGFSQLGAGQIVGDWHTLHALCTVGEGVPEDPIDEDPETKCLGATVRHLKVVAQNA